MVRRRNRDRGSRAVLFPVLRKPAVQLAIVALIAFIIYLIALGGGERSNDPAREVSLDEAYQMVQNDAFVVDAGTQAEWDEYHAPNTVHIPFDQLSARLSELPRDRQILVVCRSAGCGQHGRELLVAAGFNAFNMAGGLSEWYARGYPIEGAPQ